MKFTLLLLCCIFISENCMQIGATQDLKTKHIKVRNVWDSITNEISNDVDGGSSCVEAAATTIEENPEILLAKRSIPDHILEKRGLWGSLKKLFPIANFYNCGQFLKQKVTELSHDVSYLIHRKTRRDINVNGLRKAGLELGRKYEEKLAEFISEVNSVVSHLAVTETPIPIFMSDNTLMNNRFLHGAISKVHDFFNNYASVFDVNEAERVFFKALQTLPLIHKSMTSLDWRIFSTFIPTVDLTSEITFVNAMKHSVLAKNLMTIITFTNEVSPEFMTELTSHANALNPVQQTDSTESLVDLSSSLICANFLTKTVQITNFITHHTNENVSISDSIEMMGYLNDALQCEKHVFTHTAIYDENKVEEAGEKLKNVLFNSLKNTMFYLTQLQEHLKVVEKPVQTSLHTQEQMLLKAVTQVSNFLKNHIENMSHNIVKDVFVNVVKALRVTEKMIDNWTFLNQGNKQNKSSNGNTERTMNEMSYRQKLPFEKGSGVGSVNTYSVHENSKTAQSFIKILSLARELTPLAVIV